MGRAGACLPKKPATSHPPIRPEAAAPPLLRRGRLLAGSGGRKVSGPREWGRRRASFGSAQDRLCPTGLPKQRRLLGGEPSLSGVGSRAGVFTRRPATCVRSEGATQIRHLPGSRGKVHWRDGFGSELADEATEGTSST